jgi:hypothetical protein
MGLLEFSEGEAFAGDIMTMKDAYCSKFGFYVSSDEFDTVSMDDFIRNAETDKVYYIGGTLDYHL